MTLNIDFPRFRPRQEKEGGEGASGGNVRTVRTYCSFCGAKVTERTFVIEKTDPAERTDEEQEAYTEMAHRASAEDADVYMEHLKTAHPEQLG